jgi:hypothetical protein
VLKTFFVSYFDYRHIWLNTFMDACHLSNITKLKKKKKNTGFNFSFWLLLPAKKKGCCLPAPYWQQQKRNDIPTCRGGGRGRRRAIMGTTLEHCYKRGSGQRDFIVICMTQDLSGDD